jgi:hypothetical protein
VAHIAIWKELGQNNGKGRDAMKLNAAQLVKVEDQLGIAAVPDEHPVTSDLKDAFGDHTFFLDAGGLNIVEPNPLPGSENGSVVKVADWASEERKELVSRHPEVLPITVDLEDDGDPNSAA